MLDVQIRHQASRVRSAIGVTRGIKGHAPHDGAEKKGDDVDLYSHAPIEMRHIGIYVAVLKYTAQNQI